MNTKLIAVVVVIVVVVASVAVWQLTSTPEQTIKIGLVAPYDRAEGQDMDRAAKMAVEEINDAGGIFVEDLNKSLKIELVIANTEDGSPTKAVSPVTQAVEEDNVDLLIGGYTSSGTLADQVVAIDNRVPFIITGASSSLVTRRGPQGNYGGLPEGDQKRIDDEVGMSYMFHYCTITYDYSKTVANFLAYEMKPLLDSTYGFNESRELRLAIMYRDDAFGQGVVTDTEAIIEDNDLPIEIVIKRNYPVDTTNFQTDLNAVKDANPDALYVVDFIPGTAEVYKQGQRDVELNTVYVAVECCEDPAFYTLLGEYGDEQLLESKFGSNTGPNFYLSTIETYVTNYQEKYNTAPGMMGADTYDAFYIAKDAIERAGTLNKTAVRDALETCAINQSLIMTETGKIEFSTGVTYHEIAPVSFIEQLVWDADLSELKAKIVYPATAPGIDPLKQADFVLPEGYQPGS